MVAGELPWYVILSAQTLPAIQSCAGRLKGEAFV